MSSGKGWNRARRRRPSIALKRPVETSHARGFAGIPRRLEGIVQRLLRHIEIPQQADQRREDMARMHAIDGIYRLSRIRHAVCLLVIIQLFPCSNSFTPGGEVPASFSASGLHDMFSSYLQPLTLVA
jgi:hypothetical protein